MPSVSRPLMILSLCLFTAQLVACQGNPFGPSTSRESQVIASWTPIAEPTLAPTIEPSPFPEVVAVGTTSSSVVAHLAEFRRPTPEGGFDETISGEDTIDGIEYINQMGGYTIIIPSGLISEETNSSVNLTNENSDEMMSNILVGAAEIPDGVDPGVLQSELIEMFAGPELYETEDPLPIAIDGTYGFLIYKKEIQNENVSGATAVFHDGETIAYVNGQALESHWEEEFKTAYLKTLLSFVLIKEELETS